MNRMVALLWCATVLLVGGAAAKDSCSKEWLRYRVVAACSMEKRHLERRRPISGQNKLNALVEEVLEEMNRMSTTDDKKPEDAVPQTVVRDSSPAEQRGPPELDLVDKTPSASIGSIWTRLSEHPYEVLGIANTWLGLFDNNHANSALRRRSIQNMISRCCSDECSDEDFEGVC